MSERIRVLFFVTSLGGGGAESHSLRVINHLERSKFDVTLAVVRGGGSYEARLAIDVPMHALYKGRSSSHTLQLLGSLAPLRRLIQEVQPDVVCSVTDTVNVITTLATRSLADPPKLVLSIQTPHCALVTNRVQRLVKAILPLVYPRADRIVASSHGVAQELIEQMPASRHRIEVIYNAGVDQDVLEGAHEQLEDAERVADGKLLVACGRLTEVKGYLDLLDAFAKVRETLPSTYLYIVGEGRQRPELNEKIKRLSLDTHVHLLGFKNNPFKYMAAADVFVLSSLYEGFGNVIVEAMASGTAVVSTDCPYGPGEIIDNGRNGLLVPPRSPDALAEGIIRVLSDDELRKTLAKQGAMRAADFDAGTVASQYGGLFERLVAEEAQMPPLARSRDLG